MGKRRPQPWPHRPARAVGPGREEITAHPSLAVCPVCGETFDPWRYQILVSALDNAAFNRIECADEALAAQRLTKKRRTRRRPRRL